MAKPLDGILSIEDFELDDKKVFIRVDFNVPIENGKITDDTRIQGALPTIRYALEKGAKIILGSHFGRPKSEADRPKNSLEPIAKHLSELLDVDVILVEDPGREAPKALLSGLKSNQILMLENLRFHPGEEKNDHEFALKIASYTDIYINDAFGASHRAHASIVALPGLVEKKGIGFLMKKEIEMLDRVRSNSESPYYAILGGSKVSDKIDIVDLLVDQVDGLMIGGAMAYTFLATMAVPLGKSRIEREKMNFARGLIDRMKARGKKLLLPVDHVVVSDLQDPSKAIITKDVSVPEGMMAVDIGPKTRELFAEHIKTAKTIFWNGPMGIFETPEFSKGSFAVAKALSESDAVSIVGGGDSASAAIASGYAEGLSHISTGGGASLEFIQGLRLPGLEALRPAKRSEA
jgi:phosphoglycerate kinase